MGVEEILEKGTLEKQDLVTMLGAEGDQQTMLLGEADRIRRREVGSLVHFRGLVEFSNICGKDCYYCGIRRSNRVTRRYDLTDEQILDAARYAWKHDYGSFIMQSGERTSRDFTSRIEHLLRQIKDLSGGALGITLSLGEQSSEV
jgi:biotin synthase